MAITGFLTLEHFPEHPNVIVGVSLVIAILMNVIMQVLNDILYGMLRQKSEVSIRLFECYFIISEVLNMIDLDSDLLPRQLFNAVLHHVSNLANGVVARGDIIDAI